MPPFSSGTRSAVVLCPARHVHWDGVGVGDGPGPPPPHPRRLRCIRRVRRTLTAGVGLFPRGPPMPLKGRLSLRGGLAPLTIQRPKGLRGGGGGVGCLLSPGTRAGGFEGGEVGVKLWVKLGCSQRYDPNGAKWPWAGQLVVTDFVATCAARCAKALPSSAGTSVGGFGLLHNWRESRCEIMHQVGCSPRHPQMVLRPKRHEPAGPESAEAHAPLRTPAVPPWVPCAPLAVHGMQSAPATEYCPANARRSAMDIPAANDP